jgi:hypothetical protein
LSCFLLEVIVVPPGGWWAILIGHSHFKPRGVAAA